MPRIEPNSRSGTLLLCSTFSSDGTRLPNRFHRTEYLLLRRSCFWRPNAFVVEDGCRPARRVAGRNGSWRPGNWQTDWARCCNRRCFAVDSRGCCGDGWHVRETRLILDHGWHYPLCVCYLSTAEHQDANDIRHSGSIEFKVSCNQVFKVTRPFLRVEFKIWSINSMKLEWNYCWY